MEVAKICLNGGILEQDNDGFGEGKSKSEIESAHDSALMPFNNPLLHQHLLKMASKNFIYIDDISANEVITGKFSTKEAKTQIASFKDFLTTHKDELDALSISLYIISKLPKPQTHKSLDK